MRISSFSSFLRGKYIKPNNNTLGCRENQNNFFVNCIILESQTCHMDAFVHDLCFLFHDSTSPTKDLESEISQRMENVTTVG